LAVDLVALLKGLLTHLVGLVAFKFDLMIGAKGFHDGIETLPWPWHPWTQMVDGHPIMSCAQAVISVIELLTLELGV
jgi:hypothetical protein